MTDISLAGLIGAIVGTIVSALAYGSMVDFVERRLRGRRSQAIGDPATASQELALLRRGLLALDIALLAGLGYWIGSMVGD